MGSFGINGINWRYEKQSFKNVELVAC